MKRSACLLFFACLVYPGFAASRVVEGDHGKAQDMIVYLLSLTSQTTREMCTPLVSSFPKDFDSAYPAWLEANQTAIARGRDEAVAALPRGNTIEAYEAETIAAFGRQFSVISKDRQKKRCTGALATFTAAR